MSEETITVQVKLFAAPREALGTNELEMSIPKGSTVSELVRQLKQQEPILEAYTRTLSVAVNRTYVGFQKTLEDGDTVALLPPVGGG